MGYSALGTYGSRSQNRAADVPQYLDKDSGVYTMDIIALKRNRPAVTERFLAWDPRLV